MLRQFSLHNLRRRLVRFVVLTACLLSPLPALCDWLFIEDGTGSHRVRRVSATIFDLLFAAGAVDEHGLVIRRSTIDRMFGRGFLDPDDSTQQRCSAIETLTARFDDYRRFFWRAPNPLDEIFARAPWFAYFQPFYSDQRYQAGNIFFLNNSGYPPLNRLPSPRAHFSYGKLLNELYAEQAIWRNILQFSADPAKSMSRLARVSKGMSGAMRQYDLPEEVAARTRAFFANPLANTDVPRIPPNLADFKSFCIVCPLPKLEQTLQQGLRQQLSQYSESTVFVENAARYLRVQNQLKKALKTSGEVLFFITATPGKAIPSMDTLNANFFFPRLLFLSPDDLFNFMSEPSLLAENIGNAFQILNESLLIHHGRAKPAMTLTLWSFYNKLRAMETSSRSLYFSELSLSRGDRMVANMDRELRNIYQRLRDLDSLRQRINRQHQYLYRQLATLRNRYQSYAIFNHSPERDIAHTPSLSAPVLQGYGTPFSFSHKLSSQIGIQTHNQGKRKGRDKFTAYHADLRALATPTVTSSSVAPTPTQAPGRVPRLNVRQARRILDNNPNSQLISHHRSSHARYCTPVGTVTLPVHGGSDSVALNILKSLQQAGFL